MASKGARMIVDSASPVLVVKTVLSVLLRCGRVQLDALFQRDLFLVDTRKHRDDVARGRDLHGGADGRVGVFTAAGGRGGVGSLFDEQVLSQRWNVDGEVLDHRAGQHVAGDVADSVGARCSTG